MLHTFSSFQFQYLVCCRNFHYQISLLCRLFWLLVVTCAIVFFTTQVFLRTQEYLRYKTNINMELHFKDQLPFPAVTVCNQNTHRMTAAVDMDLYYFLEAVYTEDDIASECSHQL